ncbi:TPA: RNA-directed DNA polymerase, partial [Klebsiella pneumoniae]|nr:RNA-directed DNA polymerase [Klebsiella pneumoniae]
MEVNTNFRLLLWGVSIIQPSSPDEVLGYLKAVLNDDGLLPEIEVMEDYFDKLKKIGYIEQVSKRNNLFSITPQGNEKLPPRLKKLRDKIRIFLLDKCYIQSKLERLASTETEKMSGDSPFLTLRHILKEVPHPSLPWATGTLPSRPRQAWVRIYEQLKIGSTFGDEASTSITDTSPSEVKKNILSLNFYSFNNLEHNYF